MEDATFRERAVYLDHAGGVLIVSDLHVGRDEASGVSFPLGEREDLQERLSGLLAHFNPEVVVLAGDILHRFEYVSDSSRSSFDELQVVCAAADVTLELVGGNHDTVLAEVCNGPVSDEYVLGGASGNSLGASDDPLGASDDPLGASDDSLGASDDSLGASDDSLGAPDDSFGADHGSVGSAAATTGEYTPAEGGTICADPMVRSPVEESNVAHTVVCHGHEPPATAATRYLIGHLHPAIEIEGDRHPCYLVGEGAYHGADVIVLPAFNRLAPGVLVNRVAGTDLDSPLLPDAGGLRPVVYDTDAQDTLWFPPLADLRRYL